ncbi:hypothetical protein F4604DRAFT_1684382 [Suillus subluteus]|nr:hypothetical protein F4604DRAFT_1684382 [Suillus subluteus]
MGCSNIPSTDYQTSGNADVFGENAHPFDSINWEDPSLFAMPLSTEELELINGLAMPYDPASILPEPNSSESMAPSHSPSPTGPEDRGSKAFTQCYHHTLEQPENQIESLTHANNVTPKHINEMINGHTKHHTTRKVQLTNALVHAKAKEMDANQPVGSRYTLVELWEMDEKAAYITVLTEHRDQKTTNVRANNLAAARDVLLTTDRVVKEFSTDLVAVFLVIPKLDDLRVRTSTYATVFVVCGHVNDTIQSSMHGTDNSEDFWEDVYDLPMADYLRQYEQWACTQNQNLNKHNSLETTRKQVRKLIVRRLITATGKKDITMNYDGPPSVKFTSPSNIGTVAEIRKLCDALRAHTCYWAVLTPGEVKACTAKLDARCSAADVVRQPRKKRSDAGVSHKRKAKKDNNGPSKKVKKLSANHCDAPKSAEFIELSDKEDVED